MKRKLLVCCLALLCLTGCGKKDVVPPMYYTLGEDTTPSLDQVMEEGEGTLLTIEETKSAEEGADSVPVRCRYTYDIPAPAALVDRYISELLKEEHNFVLTDIDHVILMDRPELEDRVGEVILARESEVEGRLFQIAVGWSEEGNLSAEVSVPEAVLQEPEKSDDEPASLDEQMEYMQGLDPARLGLSGSSMDEYEIFPVEGLIQVDDFTCRRFNIYEIQRPDGEAHIPVIVGTYFLSTDQQHIYRQDSQGGALIELT